MLIRLIVEIIIGGICGYAANSIMKADTSNTLKNIILGIVGGFVGGLIGNLLGIGGGWLMGIILSIGGACLVVWLSRKLSK